MEPILKWAGGKRQLLNSIEEYVDVCELVENESTYYEPFFGGGAVCLYFELPKCVISDYNEELINVYKQVKQNPCELIDILKFHKSKHSKDYYYKIRELDRKKGYSTLRDVERAARIIYLNKTCYNGLFRVNRQGFFNVPMGRQSSLDIVMEKKINELHNYLANNDIIIRTGDFENAVNDAKFGDFVYFDPPYDYEQMDGFTSYIVDGFDRDNLNRLKACCDRLINNGCKVLVSNNDTTYVRKLFSDRRYSIFEIEANRSINRNAKKRKGAKEVLIYGKAE